MKTKETLSEKLIVLNLENPTFLLTVREDDYENTNDAKYLENDTFETFEQAFQKYKQEIENISTFETDSEYKEVEIIAVTEDGDYDVLDSETYVQQYTEKDYGKYLISYLKGAYNQTNNGISGITVEEISKYTKFNTSSEGNYGVKFQVEDTKIDAINFIYNGMLFVSKKEAKNIFKNSLK